jgi:hypothetical protein
MRSRLTKASIKPPTSDPTNMNGTASRTILIKTMAKELRELDSGSKGRKTMAAVRKSPGR